MGRRRAPVQPVQSGEAMLLTGMPSRRRVVRIPVWDLSKTSQASSSLSRIIRSMEVSSRSWHLGRSTWLAAEQDQFHVDGSRTAVTTCRIASITSSGSSW